MDTRGLGPNTSVRKLLRTEARLLADHFLRLDGESRRSRFAHSVNDAFVVAHAMRADDPGSIVYAVLIDGVVRAAAELKQTGGTGSSLAEAAFSVERQFSNRGFASELMGRIILSARNRGVRSIVMTCLVENAKMQAIARKYKAELHLEHGDIAADISAVKPDYMSLATEALEDRFVIMLSILDLHARGLPRVA